MSNSRYRTPAVTQDKPTTSSLTARILSSIGELEVKILDSEKKLLAQKKFLAWLRARLLTLARWVVSLGRVALEAVLKFVEYCRDKWQKADMGGRIKRAWRAMTEEIREVNIVEAVDELQTA